MSVTAANVHVHVTDYALGGCSAIANDAHGSCSPTDAHGSVTDDVHGSLTGSVTDDVHGSGSVTDDAHGSESVTDDAHGSESVTDDVHGSGSVTDDVHGSGSVTDDALGIGSAHGIGSYGGVAAVKQSERVTGLQLSPHDRQRLRRYHQQ